MSMRSMIAIASVVIGSMAGPGGAPAQDDGMQKVAPPGSARPQEDRLRTLERRLDALERRDPADNARRDRFEVLAMPAITILLIGLFCGLWARGTRRDFWLWFVAGLLFNVFALITVAIRAEEDKKAKRLAAEKAVGEPLDI